ncbi:MAG TPA: hypothetical protein VK131_07025 [Candidatus Acidoferrales bacterium]|nr:hypothetical protein [Candidatus Acidoferrales bacterium]
MAKGRDKQGREAKKKKKPKLPPLPQLGPNVDFRHHSVVAPPEPKAE